MVAVPTTKGNRCKNLMHEQSGKTQERRKSKTSNSKECSGKF
jgi:hypothetical protein